MKPANSGQPLAITGLPASLMTPQVMAIFEKSFDHRGLAVVRDGADLVVSVAHPPVSASEVLTLANPSAPLRRVQLAIRDALAKLKKENLNG